MTDTKFMLPLKEFMADSQFQLGNYLLLEKMAQGGMAQVFKAKTVDPHGIERLVVIKRILPHISSDSDYIKMLIDEAKIAVHFTHGNIAQIYDLARVGEDYFIAMEYVDGKTLGQILREFREQGLLIPLELIAYCVSELCFGLDYIHRKTDFTGKPLGVVHRDISPQNIIVSYSGTVKIIDFGVAKAAGNLSQTQSGILKGKFAYMSPEQADGDVIDRRSDIFSTGILLWELLTAERLFKKETNKETLKAVRNSSVSPPSKIRKEVPAQLDHIVQQALKKKKEKRYQYASEMGYDLSRFLSEQYPNFRRMDVTRFLYHHFGVEPDEEGLPPEFPELAVEREKKRMPPPKKNISQEEKTEVDYPSLLLNRFLAPLTWIKSRMGRKKIAPLLVLVAILFLAGFFLWYKKTSVGILVFQVTPSFADITLNGEPVLIQDGRSLIKIKAGFRANVKFSASGYVAQERSILLERGEHLDVSIQLQKEIPPYGAIFVFSDPAGATLHVNGVEWSHTTPTEIPHLQSDKTHTISLFLEGYLPEEAAVDVKKGETSRLGITLKKEFAVLEIVSNPLGALVLIEGQTVGTTPYLDRKILPNNTLEFEIVMNGYEKLSQSITLLPGENKKLIFDLQKSENTSRTP